MKGSTTPILGTSEATPCVFNPIDSPTSHSEDTRTLTARHCVWACCRVDPHPPTPPPPHRPALQLQSCLHRLKSQTLRRRLNGSTSARTSAQTLLRRQNTTANPISAKTGTFVNRHPLAALFYNVTTPQTVAATNAVTPTHLTPCTPAQRGGKKKRFLLLSDKSRRQSARLIKSGISEIVSIWRC